MGNRFSFHSRAKSFVFAWNGLKLIFKTQHNFWIHCVAAVLVTCAGFYFQISRYEWLAVVLAMSLVFLAECFNTALELLTDLVEPEFNPKAGKVKDAAAGGVLVAAILAAIVGLIVFLPKVFF